LKKSSNAVRLPTIENKNKNKREANLERVEVNNKKEKTKNKVNLSVEKIDLNNTNVLNKFKLSGGFKSLTNLNFKPITTAEKNSENCNISSLERENNYERELHTSQTKLNINKNSPRQNNFDYLSKSIKEKEEYMDRYSSVRKTFKDKKLHFFNKGEKLYYVKN
jgi:hypothetical protein